MVQSEILDYFVLSDMKFGYATKLLRNQLKNIPITHIEHNIAFAMNK